MQASGHTIVVLLGKNYSVVETSKLLLVILKLLKKVFPAPVGCLLLHFS